MRFWGIEAQAVLFPWGALSLLWAGALGLMFPVEPHTATLLMGGVVCLGASVVDWHIQCLPDVFTLGGGACIVGLCAWTGGGETALTGAALGFSGLKLLQCLLRRAENGVERLGSGDAKLMLSLGAMTGPWGLLPTLMLACLITLLPAMLRRSQAVAFGPGLTLGALLTVLLGLRWPPII